MSCAARWGHGYARGILAVPLALALGLAGTACGDEARDAEGTGDTDRVGETVTVRAEVNEVLGPHAFTVSGTGLTSTDELLVASREAVAVRDESEVEVTGVLHEEFDAAAVGEELGLEWKPDPYPAWEGEYYVVASKVGK